MEDWGVGSKKDDKAFAQAIVGRDTVDLIFGEYPHSRSDNNIYARFPDGRVEGFDGHGVLVDVNVASENYLKSSGLSGNEVRKKVMVTIALNRNVVYEDWARDPQRALLQAWDYVDKLLGLPWPETRNPSLESLRGEKIFYANQPAIIKDAYPGGLIIEADGCEFKKPVYYEDYQDWDSKSLKVHILDSNIWWYRN